MGHTDHTPGRAISTERTPGQNTVTITCENKCQLRLYILTDHMVRLRYANDGIFENDFSYAITGRFTPEPPEFILREHEHHFEIRTSAIAIHVSKPDSTVIFTDLTGRIICRDEQGYHWEENHQHGGSIVKMSKVVQEGEHYYGMGDKTTHLNLRGKRVTNWAMDTYGFKKEEDPIYKAIPFYTAIHNGMGYGIFFDNTFKSHFDFGSERRTVSSFWAEGGEMNYYFIYGPSLIDVTRRYTHLTGVPELPPLWALGYQQSKWSYYPESKVREVCDKMREHKIPCDAIYLDIDYMDGYRCFTWDSQKFPAPEQLIKDLATQGFKTVVIIDPGIKDDPGYHVFNQGIEENHFCRRADGPLLKGNVWPGDCCFPDFTNPKTRKWWSGLFQELIEKQGVRGVWNDMNEPALLETEGKTFPADVRHDYDGNPCSHRKAHNIYGMQMARATYKGVKKHLNGLRPLVISRSAYAGTQRYASSWTGDNIATWEHLWIANMQCQRLSISGFSFVGSDIGGFIDHPTPELYIRWMQLAVFHPFFRTHSSGDHGDQEPWSFGTQALEILTRYIRLRYELLPYVYTAFYQYVKEYTPILRPISLYDQNDQNTLYRVDEFMFGDHILVCPVLEPNVKTRYIYLPEGRWYHYWTDKILEGGNELTAEAPLEQIPIYIREGAVLPMAEAVQYVGQKPQEQLTLHVYWGSEETISTLYEDAGDGYDYEKGIYNLKVFRTTSAEGRFSLTLKASGHYETDYQSYRIVVHGLPFVPVTVKINQKEVAFDPMSDGVWAVTAATTTFNSLELQGH